MITLSSKVPLRDTNPMHVRRGTHIDTATVSGNQMHTSMWFVNKATSY